MGHTHAHHHGEMTARKLAVAFFLSIGILAVLLVGAVYSGSLALLADAGHVVTDIAALGLSWYATRQAAKPTDPVRTFGRHRAGILAALLNASMLIAVAGWIAWEAYERVLSPQPVSSVPMIAAAAFGLFLNLGIAWWLHSESQDNLNVRSAFLHVLGDAGASAGVIAGALLIAATGWHVVDPLLSVAIAAFVAYGAWQVVDESLQILMEHAPRHLDTEGLQADLLAVDGVQAIHDLHVWSIASGITSLSCHVLIRDERLADSLVVIAACNRVLAERHGITHTTLQAEAEHCSPGSENCNLALVQSVGHAHLDHDHPHPH